MTLLRRLGGNFNLQWPYVLIVCAPILVFFFAELIVGKFTQTPSFQAIPLREDNYLRWIEEAPRLQFFALFLLFCVFSWGIIIKFCFDLCLFDWNSRGLLALAFFLCVLAGATIIFSATQYHFLPRSFEYFGEDPDQKGLFQKALESTAAFTRKGWLDWETFNYFMTAVNFTAGLVVPAFIAGGISCLGQTTEDRKGSWNRQRERLQTYIYLSSAVLVISVIFMKVWTQYPSFILKQDSAILKAYSAVVNSYSVFTGIEYTLLLAAYAVPVGFFLSRQADKIAKAMPKDEANLSVRDIRARENLTISTQDILKSVIALLSPLITGSIASLGSLVS